MSVEFWDGFLMVFKLKTCYNILIQEHNDKLFL